MAGYHDTPRCSVSIWHRVLVHQFLFRLKRSSSHSIGNLFAGHYFARRPAAAGVVTYYYSTPAASIFLFGTNMLALFDVGSMTIFSCWMEESRSTWILSGPVCLSMLANAFFLVNIVRVLVTKLRAPSTSSYGAASHRRPSNRAVDDSYRPEENGLNGRVSRVSSPSHRAGPSLSGLRKAVRYFKNPIFPSSNFKRKYVVPQRGQEAVSFQTLSLQRSARNGCKQGVKCVLSGRKMPKRLDYFHV